MAIYYGTNFANYYNYMGSEQLYAYFLFLLWQEFPDQIKFVSLHLEDERHHNLVLLTMRLYAEKSPYRR